MCLRPAGHEKKRFSAVVRVPIMTDPGPMTTYAQRKVIPMGTALRRGTLVVHIAAAGAWIGIDVIVGVLVLAGWFTADPAVQGLAYQALGTFAVGPMLVSSLMCLVSGGLLGLGTRFGLLRYWWVAIKLAMNIILCLLILFALQPGMPEIVEYGRLVAAGGDSATDVSQLFFPPAVSLTALTIATILAVFKPGGRIQKNKLRPGIVPPPLP
jgi:hypothetical protein